MCMLMPIESNQPTSNQNVTISGECSKNLTLKVNNETLEIPIVRNQLHQNGTTYFHKELKCHSLSSKETEAVVVSLRSQLSVRDKVICDQLRSAKIVTKELKTDSAMCKSITGNLFTVGNFISDHVQTSAFNCTILNADRCNSSNFSSSKIHAMQWSCNKLNSSHVDCNLYVSHDVTHVDNMSCATLPTCKLLVDEQKVFPAQKGYLLCHNGTLSWTENFHSVSLCQNQITLNNTTIDLPIMHQLCTRFSTEFGDVKAEHVESRNNKCCTVNASESNICQLFGDMMHFHEVHIKHFSGVVSADSIVVNNLNCSYTENGVLVNINNHSEFIEIPVENHQSNRVQFENLNLQSAQCLDLHTVNITCEDVTCDTLVANTVDKIVCEDLHIKSLPYGPSLKSVDANALTFIDGVNYLNLPTDHQSCNDKCTTFHCIIHAEDCKADTCTSNVIRCDKADMVTVKNTCTFVANNVYLNEFKNIYWNKNLLVLPDKESLLRFHMGQIQCISKAQFHTLVTDSIRDAIDSCILPFTKQSNDEHTTYFNCKVECNELQVSKITAQSTISNKIQSQCLQVHELNTGHMIANNVQCFKLNIQQCIDTVMDLEEPAVHLDYTDGCISFKTAETTCSVQTPLKYQQANSNETIFTGLTSEKAECEKVECVNVSAANSYTTTIQAGSLNSDHIKTNEIKTEQMFVKNCSRFATHDLQNIHTNKDILLTYNDMQISIPNWPLQHITSSLRHTNFSKLLCVDNIKCENLSVEELTTNSLVTDICTCTGCIESVEIECDSLKSVEFVDCQLPYNVDVLPDFDAVLVCDGESVFWEPI